MGNSYSWRATITHLILVGCTENRHQELPPCVSEPFSTPRNTGPKAGLKYGNLCQSFIQEFTLCLEICIGPEHLTDLCWFFSTESDWYPS